MLAGMNHALILARHGLFWDYQGVATASAVYWSSLTLINPLVALLLLVRPRIGVPAAVMLIAVNVAHNLMVRGVPPDALTAHVLSSWLLMSQIGFLLFVLATWPMARVRSAA